MDEAKCGFCHTGEDMQPICGFLHKGTLDGKIVCAHHKCMQYSANLGQYKTGDFGGFQKDKVLKEIKRGSKLACCICKLDKKKKNQNGATAGCAWKPCRKTYHYLCVHLRLSPETVEKRYPVKLRGEDLIRHCVFCSQEHEEKYRQKHMVVKNETDDSQAGGGDDTNSDAEDTTYTVRHSDSAAGEHEPVKKKKKDEHAKLREPHEQDGLEMSSSGMSPDEVIDKTQRQYYSLPEDSSKQGEGNVPCDSRSSSASCYKAESNNDCDVSEDFNTGSSVEESDLSDIVPSIGMEDEVKFQTMSNWRNSRSLGECLTHLCMSEDLSDITFTFQGESAIKLHAHKFVLSMRSKVFESMFHGQLRETNREIELTDIISSTMKILLRYMYSDQVKLDENNVLSCLYAAKKYALTGLIEKCSVFLKKCLSVKNVCSIYEQSKFYDMKDFQKESFKFILKHTTQVFNDPSILKISRATLKDLLANENLCCDEKYIFLAVKQWAEYQCKVNKTPVNPTNLREYLGEILYLIRFPVIPLEDFASIIVPTDILSKGEQLQLFKAMTLSPKLEQPNTVGRFSSIKRKGQCFSLDLSTVSVAACNNSYGYNNFNNYNVANHFSFQSSKKVKIHALSGSFISDIESITGPVVHENASYPDEMNVNVKIPSSSIEYDIDGEWLTFRKPLIISPEKMNTLIFQFSASFPNPNTMCVQQQYYVMDKQCCLEKEGVKFVIASCPNYVKFVRVSHV